MNSGNKKTLTQAMLILKDRDTQFSAQTMRGCEVITKTGITADLHLYQN